MRIEDRRLKIRNELELNSIDVAFILKPHDVFYLAGYAPVCAGILMFPDSDSVFCTLWLDAPEAKQNCVLSDIKSYVFPRENLISKMIQLVKKRKSSLKKIGIEIDYLLFRDYKILSKEFPQAEFINITPLIDQLRAIKSEDEIKKIQKASAISDKSMEAALKAVKPGVSELDVAAEAEYVMKKLGAEKTAFSTFVASGERTLLAHPIASRRKIRAGETVVIDLGASWDGYASDICRTTFAGEPNREQVETLKIIVEAQNRAANLIHDGIKCNDVFNSVFEVFQTKNLGKFLPDDIGYGVGLRQSEFYPIIEKNSQTILKENMVVAFLQTTSFSKKVGGLRVEDTFRISVKGCEKLTRNIQYLFD